MKGKKGILIFLALALIIGSSFMGSGLAEASVKTIKGWFDSDIKVFHNGQKINLSETPIIHQKEGATGGTTYIAVRDLAQLLNKTVNWDGANYSVKIDDLPDLNQQKLMLELMQKQEENKLLKDKIVKLEKDLKEAEKVEKVTSLRDLEDYLNDKHDTFNKLVDFDIILSGTTRKMTVKIYEKKTGKYVFEDMYDSEVKKYIEGVVDSILLEFKDADIEGYIENYSGKKVVDFYVNTRGNVILEDAYEKDRGDLRDLENYLNKYYSKYEGIAFEIALKENYNKSIIELDVFVDKYDWDKLKVVDQDKYLESLYDEVVKDFKNHDIEGTIYDSYNSYNKTKIYYFDFDRNGDVKVW